MIDASLTRSMLAALFVLIVPACDSTPEADSLSPLSAGEISSASALLRAAGILNDSVTVLLLVLDEPDKDSITGQPHPRRAEVQLLDQPSQAVSRVTIDLDNERIISRQALADIIPPFTRIDGALAMRLLNADSTWQRGLSRRGLRSSDVYSILMGPGTLDSARAEPTHRYLRVGAALRAGPSPFATPVEGLIALVDLSDRRVIDIHDGEVSPPPIDTAAGVNRASRALPPFGAPSSRLFTVRGNSVAWLGWTFQFALHPREGLVLYNVAHERNDTGSRSILARASIGEMLVPYGDASPAWSFRSVFDVGEFGLGVNAATLIPGADVPAGALRLDAVLANDRGEPRTLNGVVGIYERDGGLLWRHRNRAERSRELVIRFATTVGNYDYGFSWVFSPDGVIAMEIDLTGMMQVKGVDSADARFGVAVTPHLSAIHHQHFFSFRLDFDVDGRTNRVREIEVAALPVDSANPTGTAFALQSTILQSEKTAIRDAAPARSRFWIVENAESPRASTGVPGYTVHPATMPDLLTAAGSSLSRRGLFATHPLWVTAFAAGERYPAGDYPGQDPGTSGLSQFSADDAPVDGADLVLWYTTGMTHVPRPEEWPIMPVNRLRFEMRPSHFSHQAARH